MDKVNEIAYHILYLAIILALCGVHQIASYNFPTPWPDESSFLWPAISVAKAGTLISPVLNEDRELFWNPPGYMLVNGLVFKFTEFSLWKARLISLLCMVGSFMLIASMIWKHPLRLASLGLCGMFFLNHLFIVAGNIARMEAMVILFATAGFWMLHEKRHLLGLTLLILTPLIHPNGVFFIAGGLAYLAFTLRPRLNALKSRFAEDYVCAAAAALAWLVYLIYLSNHWQYYLRDMSFQYLFMIISASSSSAVPWYLIMSAFILLSVGVLLKVPQTILMFYGVPALLINFLRWEPFYEVYEGLFLLTASLFILQLANHLLIHYRPWRRRKARNLILLTVYIVVLIMAYSVGMIENPIGYPYSMEFKIRATHISPPSQPIQGFRVSAEPYLIEAYRPQIIDVLKWFRNSDTLTHVEFVPPADAFFFLGLEGGNLRFSQSNILSEKKADIYIVHMSDRQPDTSRALINDLMDNSARSNGNQTPRIIAGGGNDTWYLIRA